MIRNSCPIHNEQFISISKSTLTEKPYHNHKGRLVNKRAIIRSYTQRCPTCIDTNWTKKDVYAGFDYIGDFGNEYRTGIIAHEGITIHKSELSLGIDYESSEVTLQSFNIKDHIQGIKTFNEEWSLKDWYLSKRFTLTLFYPDHIPQLLDMKKVIRRLNLAQAGDDLKDCLHQCW